LAQNRAQAFTASQNALNRLAEKTNITTRAELTATLQKELQEMSQEFQGDENAAQRASILAQNMIENAFTEDQIILKTAQFKLDKTYKLGSLALEEAAQNAVQLGSKSDTAIINFISDEKRLDAYANGQLGDNKTQFEQALLNYLSSSSEVWDREKGSYVKGPPPKLSDRILQAIKTGDPEFYKKVTSGETVGTGTSGTVSTTTKIDTLAQSPDTSEIAAAVSNPTVVDLSQLSGEIILDGKVNLDSPIWEQTKYTRYKPEIDYPVAIGFSRVYPGAKKIAQEAGEEIGVGQGADSESQNLAQAQSDLTAFANDLLLLNTQIADDRVLKFVQLDIAKETDKLKPGGLFFKNDADARATLETLANTLALGIEKKIPLVPEFGGDASKYSEAQVQQARASIMAMLPMLNEVLAFQKGFNKNLGGVYNRPITESGTMGALEFLNNNQIQPEVP